MKNNSKMSSKRANAPAKATKKQSPVPPKPTVKAPSIANILNDRLQDWPVLKHVPKDCDRFPNELKRMEFVFADSFKRSHEERRAAYLQRTYPSLPSVSRSAKKTVPRVWRIVTRELNRLSGPVDVPYVKPVLRRFNGYIVDKSARIVFRRRVHKTSGNHPRSRVTLTPIMRFPPMPDFVLAQAWNTVCGGNYPPDGNNGIHQALLRVGFARITGGSLRRAQRTNVARL